MHAAVEWRVPDLVRGVMELMAGHKVDRSISSLLSPRVYKPLGESE